MKMPPLHTAPQWEMVTLCARSAGIVTPDGGASPKCERTATATPALLPPPSVSLDGSTATFQPSPLAWFCTDGTESKSVHISWPPTASADEHPRYPEKVLKQLPLQVSIAHSPSSLCRSSATSMPSTAASTSQCAPLPLRRLVRFLPARRLGALACTGRETSGGTSSSKMRVLATFAWEGCGAMYPYTGCRTNAAAASASRIAPSG